MNAVSIYWHPYSKGHEYRKTNLTMTFFFSAIINQYTTKKVSKLSPNKLYIKFIGNSDFKRFLWTVSIFATCSFNHNGLMSVKIPISVCHHPRNRWYSFLPIWAK